MRIFKVSIAAVALLATLILPAQANNPNCTLVDGDYIVSFPRGIGIANEMRAVPGRPIQAKFTYDTVLNGFAATLTAEQACAFQRRPGATVELDGIASTMASRDVSTTAAPQWGLDRIDEKSLPLDGQFNVDASGAGTYVYIFDTGIRSTHDEFKNSDSKSRVSSTGFSAFTDQSIEDCKGHGTHVAGTVGGLATGVASAVTLISVRVLDCNGSGPWSGIISGLDYVLKDSRRPAIVNMSLGGKSNKTLNSAVQNFIRDSGIPVVVAAGNNGRDACQFSPSSVAEAITVGAITSNDGRASFSNFGKCVDIYAPGVNIRSSAFSSNIDYVSWDGTSMATPHVTGIVARYLQANTSAKNAQITSDLLKSASGTTLRIACLTGANECK